MMHIKKVLFTIPFFLIGTVAYISIQNDDNDTAQADHVSSNIIGFFTGIFDEEVGHSSQPSADNQLALLTPQFLSVEKSAIAAEPIHLQTVHTQTDINAISFDEKISQLEKRRLALEERRLAAEEKRLEAAEQRLLAAERRLAAEQERFAKEHKNMLARNSIEQPTTEKHTPLEFYSQTEAIQPQPKINKPISDNQKKLKSVVSTTKNAAFIQLENQYYLDLYEWELKTEIYRLVEYPAWARSIGKKGAVTLNFTVDRSTRVSKVSGDNANISIQLISELHRAIMTAAKRVLPPDALPGNSWDMNIDYNFHPTDNQQATIEKPSKPLFLEREDSTVLISSDNNLSKYQKDIKGIIDGRIEYPVWAEKLNQKGKVSFEIVINKDGSVTDIIPKEVNRHLFLNQEVLKAIKDSTPLPSIPEHLRLQSTNMIIQHDFKK